MFVGRTAELDVLRKAAKSRESAFVPIYGRRRVGKTELIRQFMDDRPGIYYLGKTAPEAMQVREFLRVAATALDQPLVAEAATTTWQRALELVVEQWKGPGKLVIALDEFQWMAHASPSLPSVIQGLWDQAWRQRGDILLILCGSYIGFMEREVLGKRSPLFGRRTAQIKLAPFGYREAAEFFPGWPHQEQARVYFVCGGVPMYLLAFDRGRSVEDNIAEAILDEFAPLFREPDFLLREELRDVDRYYAVLMAIATGNTSAKDIAGAAGLPERGLHYHIQQLIELGYVGRRSPLTGARPNTRIVKYTLSDPLLRFWFRFVFPHRSFLEQHGPRRTLRERIRPDLPAYEGTCFETLCREALPHLLEREGTIAAVEVGEYWDKRTQIDLVGVRDDNWIELGECKWGTVRSTTKLTQELEAKVARFPAPRGTTLHRRYFTRRPVPRPPASAAAAWHSVEDLYSR